MYSSDTTFPGPDTDSVSTPATDVSAAPAAAITVRRMDLTFDDSLPEFWYDGDPFRSLLFSALSATFPEGERFFIDSVRHFQPRIQDKQLQGEIRAFIGQEAHHSKEHVVLNDFMSRKGYPMAKIDTMVKQGMDLMRKHLSPQRQLAKTAALEHFTALLAGIYLAHPEELRTMPAPMAKIWAWHSIEETEHKAVAFDVYKATVNSEWVRRSEMVSTTFIFLVFSMFHFMQLLSHAGQLFNLKMWARGFYHFWINPGFFRKIVPDYLRYYRRDFHPWQQDNRADMEAAKREFLGQNV